MNKIIRFYMDAAKALKLPIQYREEYYGAEISLGGKKYCFRGGYTPFNDGVSNDISLNKYSANRLLHRAGFPVPDATTVSRKERINGIWQLPPLSYPLVAKPTINAFGGGRDVFCNIQNEQTLIEYLEEKSKKYEYISLEAFERGLTAYRVLVFFNKVIGVVQRDPASVTGNGIHSIAELIERENKNRAKIKTVTLDELKVDKEYETKLKEMNLTLDYIPARDEKIVLCYVCNSMRGGTMTSLGRLICPENADLICRAAKLLNLNLVGFDVICENINRPIEKSRGFIIEANCNPDISIHEAPLFGVPVRMAEIILSHLIKKHPLAYAFGYLRQLLPSYSLSYSDL